MPTRVAFRAITPRLTRQIVTQELTREVTAFQRSYLQSLVVELQKYPPPPATSRYKRTFELQRNWRVGPTLPLSGGLTTRVVNYVRDPWQREYAQYVQGSRQTATHASTGWKTVYELMDRNAYWNGLRRIYRSHIARHAA